MMQLLLLFVLSMLCPRSAWAFAASSSSSSPPPAPLPTATATAAARTSTPGRLFVFGLGYVGARLAREVVAQPGWSVAGTVSSLASASGLPPDVRAWPFDARRGPSPPPFLDAQGLGALRQATHVLVTIPPVEGRDVVMDTFGSELRAHCPGLQWLGYLSSTSVYGDRGGGWVSEEVKDATPLTAKGVARVHAEAAWADLVERRPGTRGRIFRLAGIYGPGRNALETLRTREASAALRVDGERWVSRVHVDDIVQVVRCSMEEDDLQAGVRHQQVEVYNVADDKPASRLEVFSFAARLLGLDLEDVVARQGSSTGVAVTPQGKSSSRRARPPENKRVSNAKMQALLDRCSGGGGGGGGGGNSLRATKLRYPTYAEGLEQLWNEMGQRKDVT